MNPEIHGYRIRRELGKGGMGMVYLATCEADQRTVALKVLPPHSPDTGHGPTLPARGKPPGQLA